MTMRFICFFFRRVTKHRSGTMRLVWSNIRGQSAISNRKQQISDIEQMPSLRRRLHAGDARSSAVTWSRQRVYSVQHRFARRTEERGKRHNRTMDTAFRHEGWNIIARQLVPIDDVTLVVTRASYNISDATAVCDAGDSISVFAGSRCCSCPVLCTGRFRYFATASFRQRSSISGSDHVAAEIATIWRLKKQFVRSLIN